MKEKALFISPYSYFYFFCEVDLYFVIFFAISLFGFSFVFAFNYSLFHKCNFLHGRHAYTHTITFARTFALDNFKWISQFNNLSSEKVINLLCRFLVTYNQSMQCKCCSICTERIRDICVKRNHIHIDL